MEFYTIKEIAAMFKISYKSAYALVNTCGFPKVKIGKIIRIPKKELEAWVEKYSKNQYFRR